MAQKISTFAEFNLNSVLFCSQNFDFLQTKFHKQNLNKILTGESEQLNLK